MPDIKISPSLLAADFMRLGDEIRSVAAAGADWLHCDIIDGVFAPNITFGPAVVSAAKKAADIPLDVHLMLADPGGYIDAFADAGAHIITIHAESTPHVQRAVRRIKDCGCLAGVSICPSTPPQAVEYLLDDVDLILCMSVNPGFSWQTFIPSSLKKLAVLRGMIDGSGRDIYLQVDGGVNAANAAGIIAAGATAIVAGGAVFGAADRAAAIAALRG